MKHLKQVTPWRFPDRGEGRPFAIVPFLPSELTDRHGLVLESELDDLGWYDVAAIELPDGQQALFQRYHGESMQGTAVLVDSRSDPPETIRQIINELEMHESDLLWRHEIDPALIADVLAGSFGVSLAGNAREYPPPSFRNRR